MDLAVYCPACGSKYHITQDTSAGPLTYEVRCLNCLVGDRRQIQRDADWEALFTTLNGHSVSRVVSGALKMHQDRVEREKRIAAKAKENRDLAAARADESYVASRRAQAAAMTPSDLSYPPDSSDDESDAEWTGKAIAAQFTNPSVAWGSTAADPLKDLQDAMKKMGALRTIKFT